MTSLLSVFTAPTHDRVWLDYARELKPYDILILSPDIQEVSDAYAVSPESEITLRRWDWDDGRTKENPHGVYAQLRDDPEGLARWQIDRYGALIAEWEQEAKRRGIPFPAREQLVLHLTNEPDTNTLLPQINRNTVVAARLARNIGVKVDGLNLSTGHPVYLRDGKADWSELLEALEVLEQTGSYAVTHEYFNSRGIQHPDIKPWHILRHHWAPRGPKYKIGEFGLEEILNGVMADHHGWNGRIPAEQMIAGTDWYLSNVRDDVVAVRFYMTDYEDNRWSTFDSRPIQAQLIEIGRRHPNKPPSTPPTSTPVETHLPSISAPDTTTTVPALAHPVTEPRFRFLTQPFGARPDYYSRFAVDGVRLKGHNGLDFGTPVGCKIVAVDAGRVVEAANDPDGYGIYIKLSHAWGESLYAHLSEHHMRVGEPVSRGEYMGNSGNTGNSSGAHLHFGMRVAPFNRQDGWGGYVDPAPYLGNPLGDASQPTQPQPTQTDILPLIQSAAAEFGIQWQLLASLAWAESSWDITATSAVGAMGLCQIMPATWAEWGPKVGAYDPYDARDNLRVGAAYFKWIRGQVGNRRLALIAYNWGIGRVLAGNQPTAATVEYANRVIFGADLLEAAQ